MRVGILQYVPIKVTTAFMAFAMVMKGVYGDGEFRFDHGYPYVAAIANCSQIWAMYCLVLFYHAFYDVIKPLKPLPKFLSVKLVVFFTFWQAVVIAFFVKMHFLVATQDWTEDEIATGIQNFVITIEMFIAAVAHIYIFPYNEFQSYRLPRYGFTLDREDSDEELRKQRKSKTINRLTDAINPADIVVDMHKHILVHAGKTMKTKIQESKLHQMIITKPNTANTKESESLSAGFTDSQGYHTYPIENADDVEKEEEERTEVELRRSESLNALITQANFNTASETADTSNTSQERPLIY